MLFWFADLRFNSSSHKQLASSITHCKTKQLWARRCRSTLPMNTADITDNSDTAKDQSLVLETHYSLRNQIVQDVEKGDQGPIPNKTSSHIVCFLRWNFFSIYRRLFTVVFLANSAALLTMAFSKYGFRGLSYSNTVNAISVNILIAIFCRQEHAVNLLFRLAASIPITASLWMRRCCAEVYHYGGLHSGCGVAACFWYLAFTCLVTKHTFIEPHINPANAAIAYIIFFLLVAILVSAHPSVRHRLHDLFEAMHRFAGWTIVTLFWAQTFLTISQTCKENGSSYSRGILTSVSFWCLCIITVCIVYPWARTRLHEVNPEYLSNHVIRLHFKTPNASFCQALRVSENPFKENHAFAAIPNENTSDGFSIIVSHAGDWTRRIIQSPPRKLYIKGIPTFGVVRLATLFEPVLLVATGSGIAPLLSLFAGAPDLKCRVLWSTPDPLATFHQDIVDRVMRADPNAVIIDTRKSGRPDLVAATYRLFKLSGAEAVVIISNPKITKKLVYSMETRGVPAYAPIFDS